MKQKYISNTVHKQNMGGLINFKSLVFRGDNNELNEGDRVTALEVEGEVLIEEFLYLQANDVDDIRIEIFAEGEQIPFYSNLRPPYANFISSVSLAWFDNDDEPHRLFRKHNNFIYLARPIKVKDLKIDIRCEEEGAENYRNYSLKVVYSQDKVE